MPVNSSRFNRFLLILLIQSAVICPARAQLPELHPDQFQALGERIFINECGGRHECLTSWNEGEDFPSLGIGHFIWYQSGQDSIFEETFPDLLVWLQSQGLALPDWLDQGRNADSPWLSREQFYEQFESLKMGQLRRLLNDSKSQQAHFIVQRFFASVPKIVAASSDPDVTSTKIDTIANSAAPYGIYALIDYVHFKGTGLAAGERYQGQGWGLLQVLESMPAESVDMESFVAAAEQVLRNRVHHAPPERNEQRWLSGWLNRLQTYLPGSGALASVSSPAP